MQLRVGSKSNAVSPCDFMWLRERGKSSLSELQPAESGGNIAGIRSGIINDHRLMLAASEVKGMLSIMGKGFRQERLLAAADAVENARNESVQVKRVTAGCETLRSASQRYDISPADRRSLKLPCFILCFLFRAHFWVFQIIRLHLLTKHEKTCRRCRRSFCRLAGTDRGSQPC